MRWIPAALIVLGAAGAFLAIIFLGQNRLIYFPTSRLIESPAERGLPFQEVSLTTEDGVVVFGWLLMRPGPAPTILLLHGNAGNISHRLDKGAALWRAGFQVFLVDYRGYGKSQGKPSEGGLVRDARAAWRHLAEELSLAPGGIVLFGESLGCAPALALAADLEKRDVRPRALVLEAPFTSAREMARLVLPMIPSGWLLRSRFDNLSVAGEIHLPALVLLGDRDEVVPPEMGKRVYEALRSEPKRLLVVSGAGHNDLWLGREDELASEIVSFSRSAGP